MMSDCALCGEVVPVIFESESWSLVLNRNQNLLGKCMLVLRRHLEYVPGLDPQEWSALKNEMDRATIAISGAFQPDHFNYVFLQNQDRHIHMHIIPRYAGTRTFNGVVFSDPGFPGHYLVSVPAKLLGAEQLEKIAGQVRSCLPLN